MRFLGGNFWVGNAVLIISADTYFPLIYTYFPLFHSLSLSFQRPCHASQRHVLHTQRSANPFTKRDGSTAICAEHGAHLALRNVAFVR